MEQGQFPQECQQFQVGTTLPAEKYGFSITNCIVLFKVVSCILLSVYLIQAVINRGKVFNYTKLFVIRVKMCLSMETLSLLKN